VPDHVAGPGWVGHHAVLAHYARPDRRLDADRWDAHRPVGRVRRVAEALTQLVEVADRLGVWRRVVDRPRGKVVARRGPAERPSASTHIKTECQHRDREGADHKPEGKARTGPLRRLRGWGSLLGR